MKCIHTALVATLSFSSYIYSTIITSIALAFFTVPAFANVPSDVIVTNGSTANLTISIIIGDPPKTETSTDSQVVPIAGGGNIEFSPDQEPFTSVALNQLQFSLGNATLQYEVLCGSFLGCIDITLDLSNITATLAAPIGASFNDAGHADFNSTWRLQANYVVSSLLLNTEGAIDTISNSGFGGTFDANNGNVFIDQMYLGSILGDVPNDFGFTITLETTVGLSGTALSGNYQTLYGACCYPDGTCQNSTNIDTCISNGGYYFGENTNCAEYQCIPAVCGSGGPCGTIHGPGCDDGSCCDAVCDLNPDCCLFEWDASCAVLAVEFCNALPGNDNCFSPYPIGLERIPFTTKNSTTDGPLLIAECASMDAGQNFVHDVWFSHIPQVTNGVVISTCGLANFDTRLAVYDSCNGMLLACNDDGDGCNDGTSQLCFYGEQGQEYLIRVGGSSGWGSGELDVAWCDFVDRPQGVAVEWPTNEGGNGHWYAMYSLADGATYQDAINVAKHFGGTLATITSPEEQVFITTSMYTTIVGGVTAIGLYQEPESQEPDGGWTWITSEPVAWTNWAVGEPNNFEDEAFGMMYPDGTWNDATDAFGHVLLEFESNPNLNQATWEKDLGGNGHTYEGVIFPYRFTWEEANTYAQEQGGTLASFETEEEADWVFDELGSFTSLWSMTYLNNGPWIGLYKTLDEWQWLSGSVLHWNGWAPGEPNETGNYGAMFGSSRFFNNVHAPTASGELFGTAQLVNDFGYPRLKLVADSFPSTWGTWISDSIPENVIGIDASFRFSFKNQDGGPGDGFSFLWGDLSDTSGGRTSGGEWGVSAFTEDQAGLAVCSRTYPAQGVNGIAGKWGSQEFAFAGVDFSSVTYSDYQQAIDPANMATMYVHWTKENGVSISIAFPSNNPQVIWQDQGASHFDGVDTSNWNFGFAARNGAIDMDTLIGDIAFGYEFMPELSDVDGSPRNTFDDTYNENIRRSAIIEYETPMNTCIGDLNEDLEVGVGDLLAIIEAWGPCDKVNPCNADLDDDDVVAVGDLLVLISNWGACP